ncbi:MAG: cytochrome c1 [Mariprofundales bacterium]
MKHFVMMKNMLKIALLFIALLSISGLALASGGEEHHLKEADLSLNQETLRAGLEVFTDVCMGCHSAKYVTYRNLMDYSAIGLSREEVDDLRGDKPLLSGLVTELAPEDAKVSYGKVPPDLSVLARARHGRGHYVYSILTGYEHDPDARIPDGNYNLYMSGNAIAMPDPLAWLDHDPEETADLEEQARTVAAFLNYIGDPHQLERKAIGKYVLMFLALLTLVLYLLKKEVWRDVH